MSNQLNSSLDLITSQIFHQYEILRTYIRQDKFIVLELKGFISVHELDLLNWYNFKVWNITALRKDVISIMIKENF